ncbi:hypothetical protein [Ruminococcus callidus]|uniref:hypothetical protein n=1 Tax=Ruminococcus callidus TaxID=40519 RepID=UPI003992B7F4
MTLTMNAEEYNGVIKYLLSLPMSKADKPMLAYLYAGGGIPEVLGETSKELRARVAMNAVKAKCDENTVKGGGCYEHQGLFANPVAAAAAVPF